MSVTPFQPRPEESDSVDVLEVLMARLSASERRKLVADNVRYLEVKRPRVVFTKDKRVAMGGPRQRPEHFRRLQMAIRAQDSVNVEAAWDSCERWLMADMPVDLAAKAANRAV